ncbi:transporter substrate-binding domain-containing protein [Vibrio algarum]|uniref:histidine kinase n=1 Tax=Vibrio algarum TaxID=3020714 RepID=A0ABT4YUY4_9VIBR|nr:transporter substrate-binding domain-containing protein [Vibrio sp. KJ40-1]MDB1125382.1 transporter substrate-binding domain-containing protein [Vibrio sp. KJ40-1]
MSKVKCSPSAWLFLCTMVFFANAFASDNIVVGGDHNYPPYEFINDKGDPDGYNTELTYAIADVMGLDVKVALSSWDEMKHELENGDIDLLQGISYSEERALLLDFSPPHSLIHQSVFARIGSPPISHLSELSEKYVIVQSGGIMAERIESSGVDVRLIYVDTHAAALRMLSSGKYDYAFVANLPGLYLGKELSLSNIEPVGKPLGSQRYGYAVLKGNAELLAKFNEGLAILKNTGKQQEIYNKWFGSYTDNGVNWQRISLFVVIASILFLSFFVAVIVWNRSLAKQVARRTKKLEQQQQQLVQADKMASLGILVSGVAHEINNPTSLLLLNLPVLKESFEDIEEILEEHYEVHGDFDIAGLSYSRIRKEIPLMLGEMLEGSNHIRRIVSDLRDFARQEPQVLSDNVDLNQVVAAAIRLTDRTIKSATDDFSVSYGELLPLFKGNSQRLQQVIINLIVNACQALDNAKQAIRIKTEYQAANRRIKITVIDEGCGIDAKHISRLTDPFFTTKRKDGGTGLGLSISSNIIEEHGGKLLFESELGKGTQIKLIIPITKDI